MLKFLVFNAGHAANQWPIRNAYLLGPNDNAVRGDISFNGVGQILCHKQEPGAAGLALQHTVGGCGDLTLQTCLLPDNEHPYILNLELARHRLMVLYSKLEDWSMFELGPDHAVNQRLALAKQLFIEALCCQRQAPAEASSLAQQSLVLAIDASEELAMAQSGGLLTKRKASGLLPKYLIGCGIGCNQDSEAVRATVRSDFDVLHLPVRWRNLTPEEGDYSWKATDHWAKWVAQHRQQVIAGPIVCFDPQHVPDWLFIWEHDFDALRDLIYEHTERVVKRYRKVVSGWNVVSGLHINDQFTLSFEQLIDVTRMTTMLVKKIQPAAKALVEIRQPFGEYYGADPRSIPPLIYADLLVQGAINFDGFVIQLLMGHGAPGYDTRDLMQVSCLLDQFARLNKPVHLSVAVPSQPSSQAPRSSDDEGEHNPVNNGFWRQPWSLRVQGWWLEAIFQIAASKPFVESVAWHTLMDCPPMHLPHSGLVDQDMNPKPAFKRLSMFKRSLHAKTSEQSTPGNLPH